MWGAVVFLFFFLCISGVACSMSDDDDVMGVREERNIQPAGNNRTQCVNLEDTTACPLGPCECLKRQKSFFDSNYPFSVLL